MTHIIISSVSFGLYSSLRRSSEKYFPKDKRELFSDLLVGLKGNIVFEESRNIWEMALEARRNTRVVDFFTSADDLLRYNEKLRGEHFLDQLESFLKRFGHRGPFEQDIMQKRWSEDPLPILNIIKAHLESADTRDPREKNEEQVERRRC